MNQMDSYENRNEIYDRKAWDYFRKVLKRPGLYVCPVTLNSLNTFFNGYAAGVSESVGYDPLRWFWQAFVSYCDQHFYQPGGYDIIHQMTEGRTEQEAWTLFFRVLDSFITENGWETILPVRET